MMYPILSRAHIKPVGDRELSYLFLFARFFHLMDSGQRGLDIPAILKLNLCVLPLLAELFDTDQELAVTQSHLRLHIICHAQYVQGTFGRQHPFRSKLSL